MDLFIVINTPDSMPAEIPSWRLFQARCTIKLFAKLMLMMTMVVETNKTTDPVEIEKIPFLFQSHLGHPGGIVGGDLQKLTSAREKMMVVGGVVTTRFDCGPRKRNETFPK